MNCWKSINVHQEYGVQRITIISIIISLLTFILLFTSFSLLFSGVDISSSYFWVLCLSIVSMFSVHKICHAVPLMFTKRKFRLKWHFSFLVPICEIKTKKSFSKLESYIIFTMPLLLITSVLLMAIFIFPAYFHYFSMLIALNVGLSVPDLLFLSYIKSAPKSCQIEELEDGYDILINNSEMK
ncbi:MULTISPECIES: DUF3267 domain-containing protein [Bacillus]|uniref:DUF3267 domain-containing protein n=1 Tax=Bacillus TaxID=1386 RepID=UPI000BB7482C|nr:MULTISPECIES: DUF3267 domain-containing protein [Bacillus]